MSVDIPLGTQVINIDCRRNGKEGNAYFDNVEVKATAIYEKKDIKNK